MRQQEEKQSFKYLSRWCKNNDVARALEALQKVVAFRHERCINKLKLGCTKPNLAHICLQSFTSAKLNTIKGNEETMLSKSRKGMVQCRTIVFTGKTLVRGTHNRKSTNICKSIVRVDSRQIYLKSMCQTMPSEFYAKREFVAILQRFKPH